MKEKTKINYKMILIMLLVFMLFYIVFNQFCLSNIKYAKDYSMSDLIEVKKIYSKDIIPTEEMVEKYDIDEDKEITNVDIELIRQMLLGYYDSYEVINSNRKTIKHI